MPTEDVSAKKEEEKSQVVRVCTGQFCIDFVGASTVAEWLSLTEPDSLSRLLISSRVPIALGFDLLRYDLADLGLEAHILNDPWYSCRKASRAENDPTLGPNCYFGPKHCPLASEVFGLNSLAEFRP
ncbi:hypothetical protein ACFXTN_022581 [Malus domestica]